MSDGELHALRDGTPVVVRPLGPDDRDAIRTAIERMSPESRYRRFLAPTPRVTQAQLRYLTDIDHHLHEALVAIDPETDDGIGVARYVATPDAPESAEIAVAVADAWQGRGVGSMLLRALGERAREEGVRRLTALVLSDNTAMIDLLSELGETRMLASDGATREFAVDVPADDLEPMRDLLRRAAAGELESRPPA